MRCDREESSGANRLPDEKGKRAGPCVNKATATASGRAIPCGACAQPLTCATRAPAFDFYPHVRIGHRSQPVESLPNAATDQASLFPFQRTGTSHPRSHPALIMRDRPGTPRPPRHATPDRPAVIGNHPEHPHEAHLAAQQLFLFQRGPASTSAILEQDVAQDDGHMSAPDSRSSNPSGPARMRRASRRSFDATAIAQPLSTYSPQQPIADPTAPSEHSVPIPSHSDHVDPSEKSNNAPEIAAADRHPLLHRHRQKRSRALNQNRARGSSSITDTNMHGSPSQPSPFKPRQAASISNGNTDDDDDSELGGFTREHVNALMSLPHATQTKPYACDRCELTFSRLHNLRAHAFMHSGDRPYCCSVCPQAFSRLHDLRRHQKLHNGARPYQCSYCHRTFARQDALTRHQRVGGTAGPCAGVSGRRVPIVLGIDSTTVRSIGQEERRFDSTRPSLPNNISSSLSSKVSIEHASHMNPKLASILSTPMAPLPISGSLSEGNVSADPLSASSAPSVHAFQVPPPPLLHHHQHWQHQTSRGSSVTHHPHEIKPLGITDLAMYQHHQSLPASSSHDHSGIPIQRPSMTIDTHDNVRPSLSFPCTTNLTTSPTSLRLPPIRVPTSTTSAPHTAEALAAPSSASASPDLLYNSPRLTTPLAYGSIIVAEITPVQSARQSMTESNGFIYAPNDRNNIPTPSTTPPILPSLTNSTQSIHSSHEHPYFHPYHRHQLQQTHTMPPYPPRHPSQHQHYDAPQTGILYDEINRLVAENSTLCARLRDIEHRESTRVQQLEQHIQRLVQERLELQAALNLSVPSDCVDHDSV